MSTALTWRPEDLLATNGAQASNVLRDQAFESQLSSLREVALTLLNAVESLSTTVDRRTDQKIRLTEEVRRFETDLIRAALVKTNGNQARAARLLNVKHTTLNAKVKRYRIAIRQTTNENGAQEIAA